MSGSLSEKRMVLWCFLRPSSVSGCTWERRAIVSRPGKTRRVRKNRIITHIRIGPPVYQCGEHWSGGPSSLVRGARKLSIPTIKCRVLPVTMPSGAGSPAPGKPRSITRKYKCYFVTVFLLISDAIFFQLLSSLLHALATLAGSRGYRAVMGTNGLTLQRGRARWVNTRRPLFTRRRRRRRGAIKQHASIGCVQLMPLPRLQTTRRRPPHFTSRIRW